MAAWYLVPKFLEQPAYKIVQTDGKIELRDYDSMLLQSVKVSGQQYDALRKGFRPLVNYKLSKYLRVSLGTMREMNAFKKQLKLFYNAKV